MRDFIKACRALGDESRMNIFQLIKHKNFCVGAIAQKLGISQSAVSQHLRVLREAGLVRAEKRGYYVHYLIEEEALGHFQEQTRELLEKREEPLPACPRKEMGEDCCLD